MGTVYLAADSRSRRLVALKLLRIDRLGADAVVRLQREFRSIASLRHPQIARAYDFGYTEEGSLPYYTREYIEGSSLAAGPPSRVAPAEFLRPVLDLLDALEYLHAHRILHLDVHAGNLIVAQDPARGAVLIDFGILLSPESLLASQSSGAQWAFPPEVLRGGPPSPASDLYLAARLLLYRLTGRYDAPPRLPREIPGWGPRVTASLERIAAKALERYPARRFSSAGDFRAALEEALGEARSPPRHHEPREVVAGRAAEMRQIERALSSAAAGAAEVLWFVGSSGMGKSLLLAEARHAAQLRGLTVVEARFLPGANASEPALVEAIRESAAGGASTSWLDPLSIGHGGSSEERARTAARSYFVSEGQPLVLLIDDFDFAGGGTRLFVEGLVEASLAREGKARGLCTIITTSSPPKPGFKRLRPCLLKPLRPVDARRLLRTLLGPLVPPPALLSRAVAAAGGAPFKLRLVARALRSSWARAGAIPEDAEVPRDLEEPSRGTIDAPPLRHPLLGKALLALEVLARPSSAGEIAATAGMPSGALRPLLERLSDAEIVGKIREGGKVKFHLTRSGLEIRARRPPSPRTGASMHRRAAEYLKSRQPRSGADLELLARHLLLAGKRAEGTRAALRAAASLRRRGRFGSAARVLEESLRRQSSATDRFRIAEELSDVLEETGDHADAVALLDPILHEDARSLSPAELVRLRRRLGVHCHRSGDVERALALFEAASAAADPERDLSELVLIDAELAELCTLRGAYDRAEAACLRGLERLERLVLAKRGFRERMEMTLRASLGHLELRRLAFARARAEIEAALRLARRLRATSIQALLLNNLGILENQTDRLSRARRAWKEAECLLLETPERRALIEVACNLAIISAKLGDARESRLEIERAAELLRQHPGSRLEFLVPYARGIAACMLGDMPGAAEALEKALPIGERIGDSHLAGYGRVYLAEAHLACGRYSNAWRTLRQALRSGGKTPPLLERMLRSRLLLVSVLLGRRGPAERLRRELEEGPRSSIRIIEAWNDLFRGAAAVLSGRPSGPLLEQALETFRRVRVPAGERFALLALLGESLFGAEVPAGAAPAPGDWRKRLLQLEAAPHTPHRFLDTLEGLLQAHARLRAGEVDLAKQAIAEASGAIVGSPFLELDWWLELLRARLARREGDLDAARRHFQRSLHTRDLLSELLPVKARKRFLAQRRFAALRETQARLASTRDPRSTESLRTAALYEGITGSAPAMLQLFREIERFREREIPVIIRGETGTGKDLVARAIHRTSPRGAGKFLAVHCASLPGELFETELFGYEAGAFTGAEESRPGLLEGAAGGTLLLDGIEDLPLGAQAKLLRVLDSGVARRVGGLEPRPIDVRFLSATTADLEDAVRSGRFRADLFFRLNGATVVIPPLRERREDIGLLARRILEEIGARLEKPAPRLSPDALRLLEGQEWRGNVRELETLLLRVVIGGSNVEVIRAGDLEAYLPRPGERRSFFDGQRLTTRSLEDQKLDLERAYLRQLFVEARGDLKVMRERLGLKRSRFYAWLRRLGLDVRALRAEI